MRFETFKKYAVPPGPILSLTLTGILFLGGTLYYRAVKVQRFLEPAVAISQPRIQFAENLSRLLKQEFGERPVKGVEFTTNSILIEKALLTDASAGPEVLRRLSRIFYFLLRDPQLRQYVDVILVNSRPASGSNISANRQQKQTMQHMSEQILLVLYQLRPELERDFENYFAAASIPVTEAEAGWMEFKIIGSEQLHIDVLMRLEKYIR